MTTLPAISLYNSVKAEQLSKHDGAIVIFTEKKALTNIVPSATKWLSLDATFGDEVQLIVPEDSTPASRVIIAPTGTLSDDVDDVRRFKDVALTAGQRALKAGIRNPLVLFADPPAMTESLGWTMNAAGSDYQNYLQVTLLALAEACFEPIDVRDHFVRTKKACPTFDHIGVVSSVENGDDIVNLVNAVETGRRVAKDIGSPDAERMSPSRIVEYLTEQFQNEKSIKMTVIDDIETIKKEYPLAHAVTRASLAVPRHHPRIVLFEYRSPDQSKVKENLYFVGKGVTFDTGGADIKCSGHMRGMSRDKCGAAAVAGFLKTIAMLQPDRVNVQAGLALVRNSVGSDSYVCDEVIEARSGVRVLVGNTDAEGRMVMTDLLSQFKDMVVADKKQNTPASQAPSFLFTVATLTGHALRAYDGYGITLDNGFSRKHQISRRIYDAGHLVADPFEISTLRREDKEVVRPGRTCEDVVQANDKPSTMTNRGHQYPAGFMLIASGLDKHCLGHEHPIGYTHMDIAGSAETISAEAWSLTRTTGSPVAALTAAFLV